MGSNLSLGHNVSLRTVFLAGLDERVPRLGAEVRYVDDGSRIVGQERYPGARLERTHALAQAQDGQGAQEATGIDDLAHGDEIGTMFQTVHKVVTECADDAGRAMG